jgi:hypothetical protein
MGEMRDQHLGARHRGSRSRRLGFGRQSASAFGGQRRLQRINVIGGRVMAWRHAGK